MPLADRVGYNILIAYMPWRDGLVLRILHWYGPEQKFFRLWRYTRRVGLRFKRKRRRQRRASPLRSPGVAPRQTPDGLLLGEPTSWREADGFAAALAPSEAEASGYQALSPP